MYASKMEWRQVRSQRRVGSQRPAPSQRQRGSQRQGRAQRPTGSPRFVSLWVTLLVGAPAFLGLSGCAKSPAPEATPRATANPNTLHGEASQFLVTPDAQIRWSYPSLPDPNPSVKPNYLLKSFLFEPGAATLNPEARGALGELVEMLAEKPTVRVLCLGLCDGNQEKVNAQNLGMNRASAAREFLLGRGVHKDRIELASFGSSMAEAPPEETVGQRLDRKVEIWLIGE